MKYNYNYEGKKKKNYEENKLVKWEKIKFCGKKMMIVVIMMREINKLNLKTKNEKEEYTNSSYTHYCKQFVFLEKIKRKASRG